MGSHSSHTHTQEKTFKTFPQKKKTLHSFFFMILFFFWSASELYLCNIPRKPSFFVFLVTNILQVLYFLFYFMSLCFPPGAWHRTKRGQGGSHLSINHRQSLLFLDVSFFFSLSLSFFPGFDNPRSACVPEALVPINFIFFFLSLSLVNGICQKKGPQKNFFFHQHFTFLPPALIGIFFSLSFFLMFLSRLRQTRFCVHSTFVSRKYRVAHSTQMWKRLRTKHLQGDERRASDTFFFLSR